MSTRRFWLALPAAVAALVVIAGCGVPTSGRPRVLDQQEGPDSVSREPPPEPPNPRDAATPADLVDLYFQAAAGEWAQGPHQVKPFLSRPDAWESGPSQITVVRLRSLDQTVTNGMDAATVVASAELLGVLTERGAVEPPAAARDLTWTFQVTRSGSGHWVLDNPPPGMFLSDKALRRYYDALPAYFLGGPSPSAVVVPDLRYRAKATPAGRHATVMVDWLLAGPSGWLRLNTAFPPNTKRRVNVIQERSKFVVDLATEAADVPPEGMAVQLAWTLKPVLGCLPLELKINGRMVLTGQSWTSSVTRNPFARGETCPADHGEEPSPPCDRRPSYERQFYVVGGGGTVRPEQLRPDCGTTEPPQLLAAITRPEDAQARGLAELVSISNTTESRLMAFVHRAAGGLVLTVGRLEESPSDAEPPPDRPGQPTPDPDPQPEPVSRPSYSVVPGLVGQTSMGRPAWVPTVPAPSRTLLVPVDGALYEVSGGTLATRVLLDGTTGVTAVAVTPDGYRAALVIAGRVWVGVLLRGLDGGLALGPLRLVSAGLTGATDVAWSRENHLVIAAQGTVAAGSGALWDASLDGVQLDPLPTPSTAVPRSVTVFNSGSEVIKLFESGGKVYKVYRFQASAPRVGSTPPDGTSPFFVL